MVLVPWDDEVREARLPGIEKIYKETVNERETIDKEKRADDGQKGRHCKSVCQCVLDFFSEVHDM
jgi:hypothetical protein